MQPLPDSSFISLHGVFMSIFDEGVCFIGDSGIGKSELALNLMDRGHLLIADDIVDFHKKNPETIWGTSPPNLNKLLEIRGLGVFDIQKLYGEERFSKGQNLSLFISLKNEMNLNHLLKPYFYKKEILGRSIPEINLDIKRPSLSLLIEAVVREHKLLQQNLTATALPQSTGMPA